MDFVIDGLSTGHGPRGEGARGILSLRISSEFLGQTRLAG
jgi:hypothetical protein